MAIFTELKEDKDFIKLNCHKASILLCLEEAKAVLETLPTDKPSLRARAGFDPTPPTPRRGASRLGGIALG